MRTIGRLSTGLAAATLMLAGTFLGTSAQSPDASPPTQDSKAAVAEEWAFFTGTIDKDQGDVRPASTEPFTENGLTIDLGGWGPVGQTIVSDDPRMTGTRSVRYHFFTDASGGGEIAAVFETIENDAGAWMCEVIYLGVTEGRWSRAGWCDGARGYEGLHAYIAMGEDVPPSSVEISGFITSADGLPFPAVPAS
jgi:hypothetical protein